MRFLPLLSTSVDPSAWSAFPAVEILWDGILHDGWERCRNAGLQIHALHAPPMPWGPAWLDLLRHVPPQRWGWDFLILSAHAPGDRGTQHAFLGTLEVLLEALHGRGPKVVLRPAPGAAPALATLLREVRGKAVGFCWDAALGADLDVVSDRLMAAVGTPEDDFTPLRRWGYRWNVAIPFTDPREAQTSIARLTATWPDVLFPEVLP